MKYGIAHTQNAGCSVFDNVITSLQFDQRQQQQWNNSTTNSENQYQKCAVFFCLLLSVAVHSPILFVCLEIVHYRKMYIKCVAIAGKKTTTANYVDFLLLLLLLLESTWMSALCLTVYDFVVFSWQRHCVRVFLQLHFGIRLYHNRAVLMCAYLCMWMVDVTMLRRPMQQFQPDEICGKLSEYERISVPVSHTHTHTHGEYNNASNAIDIAK